MTLPISLPVEAADFAYVLKYNSSPISYSAFNHPLRNSMDLLSHPVPSSLTILHSHCGSDACIVPSKRPNNRPGCLRYPRCPAHVVVRDRRPVAYGEVVQVSVNANAPGNLRNRLYVLADRQ